MSAQVHHPLFARLYARLSPRADAKGVAEHRRELLADLNASVIELGPSNGLTSPPIPTP